MNQLRHMENISCKKGAINAIKTLATHHPQEVVEALLCQPLPLSKDTETCWKELGTNDETGLQVRHRKNIPKYKLEFYLNSISRS